MHRSRSAACAPHPGRLCGMTSPAVRWLVTGGTRGIGLSAGLAFGRRGAHVTLTHKWGSADEASIREVFADAGDATPCIVQADVANDEDVLGCSKVSAGITNGSKCSCQTAHSAPTVRGVDDLLGRRHCIHRHRLLGMAAGHAHAGGADALRQGAALRRRGVVGRR